MRNNQISVIYVMTGECACENNQSGCKICIFTLHSLVSITTTLCCIHLIGCNNLQLVSRQTIKHGNEHG